MNKQCPHCLKTFGCPYSKKRHEKVCLELQAKNRLHCYICGKGFVNVQNRTRHESTCENIGAYVLQDLKKFQCVKCHHTFASKQKWKQHCCKVKQNIVKESENTNQCEGCLKSFSSVVNKKRHEKVCPGF